MPLFPKIQKYIGHLLHALFPQCCSVCKKIHSEPVCDDCNQDFIFPERPFYCPLCLQSITQKYGAICKNCTQNDKENALDYVYSIYAGVDKSVLLYIASVKYQLAANNMRKAASDFSCMLGLLDNEQQDIFVHSALVPVPLHWMRYYNRGFNQSAKLAKEICALYPEMPYAPMLKRIKYTKPQVGMRKTDRLKKFENAFQIHPKWKGEIPKNVILVDDVFTTGATMNACANVLKQAGVQNVSGLTILRK